MLRGRSKRGAGLIFAKIAVPAGNQTRQQHRGLLRREHLRRVRIIRSLHGDATILEANVNTGSLTKFERRRNLSARGIVTIVINGRLCIKQSQIRAAALHAARGMAGNPSGPVAFILGEERLVALSRARHGPHFCRRARAAVAETCLVEGRAFFAGASRTGSRDKK